METSWDKLTPDQKMDRRFAAWLAADDIEFASAEAEAAYKARANRVADAMRLQKLPDRVPVSPSIGSFAARYAGYTAEELINDTDKAIEAGIKCTLDFEPDGMIGAGAFPGKVYDMLDYRMYNWPGHGIEADGGLQYVEKEYMKPEDYDALIQDPSDFWMRIYLPQVMGALEPLRGLLPFANAIEWIATGATISRFAAPEVEEAFVRLCRAARELVSWQQKMGVASRKLMGMGFPGMGGAFALAPFDALGDTLRGTRGIITDMFRRPEKLQAALDRLTPLMIRMGVMGTRMGGHPIVMIPLHKGADGFMSEEQFKTFYWPSLRALILGLVEEGIMPRLFAEGTYDSRLEVIRDDLPKGKTSWLFDRTDMARAKEIIGDRACISGNVPAAMIHTGTPEDVTEYCKKLIDTAGKGGGFILATGAGIEQQGKAENIRAMIQCAKEYGKY
jgi:hypothetical protein